MVRFWGQYTMCLLSPFWIRMVDVTYVTSPHLLQHLPALATSVAMMIQSTPNRFSEPPQLCYVQNVAYCLWTRGTCLPAPPDPCNMLELSPAPRPSDMHVSVECLIGIIAGAELAVRLCLAGADWPHSCSEPVMLCMHKFQLHSTSL
jgi:hypothetical protein